MPLRWRHLARLLHSRERAQSASLLHRHHQVLHDVIFALGGVLAHVKAQDAGGVLFRGILHLAQAHLLANELLELRRVDLAQALEAHDFAALAQLLPRLRRPAPSLGEDKMSRLAADRMLGSRRHEDCRNLSP